MFVRAKVTPTTPIKRANTKIQERLLRPVLEFIMPIADRDNASNFVPTEPLPTLTPSTARQLVEEQTTLIQF